MLTICIFSCIDHVHLHRTINSVRNHLHSIEPDHTIQWLCLENAHVQGDRHALDQMGFDLIILSRKDLDAASAMNLIMGGVRTPYMLFLRDGWLVDNPFGVPFIREALGIMETDRKIAQVKLDAVHSIDFIDRHIYDGPFRAMNSPCSYYVQNPLSAKGGFTFSPSIINTAAIHCLGPFQQTQSHRSICPSIDNSASFARQYVTAKSPDLLVFEPGENVACAAWSYAGPVEEGEANTDGMDSHKVARSLNEWTGSRKSPRESPPSLKDWVVASKSLSRNGNARSAKEKTVLFGPWIGEFGWEICRWQGGVRKLIKENYSDFHVIVAGDPGHYPLYELANEYWTLPSALYKQGFVRETTRLLPKDKAYPFLATVRDVVSERLRTFDHPVEIVLPRRFLPEQQEFIAPDPSARAVTMRDQMLAQRGIGRWICAFPRCRALNPRKNWPEQNWQKLLTHLVNRYQCGIVILGRPEDTARLETSDSWMISLLDVDPEDRLDLGVAFLRNAICSIASESGGPFLSMLCGCPTLVMGGDTYESRYVSEENPMRTLCRYLSKPGYVHPYAEVQDEATRLIDHVGAPSDNRPPRIGACAPAITRKQCEIDITAPQTSIRPNSPDSQLHEAHGVKCAKILFVGVFDPHSTNMSQADALRRQGCTVLTYPYRLRAQQVGHMNRDQEIVSVCRHERPDLVLFSKCNQVETSVINRCKEVCPVALWYMDGLCNMDGELIDKIKNSSMVFCARRGPFLEARRHSQHVYYLQEGFDPASDYPVEVPTRYDVSLIGELRGDRIVYQHELGFHVFSNAFGAEHARAVCESRINLNFTDNGDGTSDRTYKVLASGGFLLSQPWLGMDIDFSVGNELDIFHSPDELKAKIAIYLNNEDERLRIARNGHHAVQRFSRNEWARHITCVAKAHVSENRKSASASGRKRTRFKKKSEFSSGYSILIPSWNNLPYLIKTITSIKNHSQYDHEILVHVNDGSDGTLDWVKKSGLKHTWTSDNVGICIGINRLTDKASRDLIIYFNDDMVALPQWDTNLAYYAESHNLNKLAWLSSILIEPTGFNADFIAPANYGTDVEQFDENILLADLPSLRHRKSDVYGISWAPNLMYRETFDKIGRLSEEFSPGFGSDPDLAKKLWDIGGRTFVGVGNSLIYHFQCKCTSRLAKMGMKNDGHGTFQRKHGMKIMDFIQGVLKKQCAKQ